MQQKKTLKERIDNFLYYYKWHLVFGVIALVFLVTTVMQFRSRIDYDTTVTFLGSFFQEEATMKEFQDNMEQVLSDANEDGEVHVLPYFLYIGGDVMSAQQDTASITRLQGMVMTRETSVMILDKGSMIALAEGDALEDLTPFYEEYGLEMGENPYGILIEADNPVFSMFQIQEGKYYIARLAKFGKMDHRQTVDYENAELVLRMVIEGQLEK